MKLIMAIVNNDDSHTLASGLTREGFSVTKLATTGGFLQAGNTTFIIGTEDDKVPRVIEIIGQYSRRRTQMVPAQSAYTEEIYAPFPIEVTVGGATVFVLNIENFSKL